MARSVSPPEASALAERQMRIWELAHPDEGGVPVVEDVTVHPFICVSRLAGLDVHPLAVSLGRRLGWAVFDREILTAMAEGDWGRLRRYESMDQRDLTWIEEIGVALKTRKYEWNEYYHHLTRTVISLAEKRSGIFVGRATDLILPRQKGLRARLFASLDYRIERYSRERGIAREVAASEIEKVQAERDEFIRTHFGVDPEDPARFDLLLNVEAYPTDEVVNLILDAAGARRII